jgi:multiple sugar transport system substrate-binding protein
MFRKIILAAALTLAAYPALPGETIRVMLGQMPWSDPVIPLIPQFEKETGVTVHLEVYGEDQLSQKFTVEFAAGGSDLDVLSFRNQQEGRLMEKNNWLADLTPFVKDDAEYDINDYFPSAIDACTFNGKLLAIPNTSETPVLYYRKDIFEKNGITPPKTLAELEEIAKKLTDKATDFAGIILRGQRSPLVTQLSSYVYSYGGDFFDRSTGKATLDTPEFLGAVDYYGRLGRNYAPPGILNMNWPQGVAIYTQGKGAIYLDCSSQYNQILNPKNSQLAHLTGVSMFPAGPARHSFFFVTSWGIGIANSSSHKEAAWKFVRWFTDRERTLYLQGEKSVQCCRTSIYNHPEGMKNFPKDWSDAVSESITYGVPFDRPQVIAVGEARDIIGEVAVTAILGQDYKAAAKIAQERLQALLDREGLYGKN